MWSLFPSLVALAIELALVGSVGATKRIFHLTLTWQDYAPDGFARKMILVNNQFPGPLLEMTEGDDVEVTIQNDMPFNTTVHFHGTFPVHGLGQRES